LKHTLKTEHFERSKVEERHTENERRTRRTWDIRATTRTRTARYYYFLVIEEEEEEYN
jgi:hypothetical protein